MPPVHRTAGISKPRRNPIALAREWDSLLADGTYSSRADLARGLGVSRARVTQMLNLLKLPAHVVEIIFAAGERIPSRNISEHGLRQFAKLSTDELNQAIRSLGLSEESAQQSRVASEQIPKVWQPAVSNIRPNLHYTSSP